MMMKNNTVDVKMGTWGIVLKPTLRYKVVFDRPFYLKQAVFDFNCFIKQDFHFRVMLIDNKDDQNPLTLCILNKQNTLQIALDLEFEEGDDVTFYIKTDSYNMDLNSFSVSLSGKSLRDDAFERPALPPKKSVEALPKARSASQPDEGYHQKPTLPSPLMTKSHRGSSLEDENTKNSSSAKLLRAESVHEERTHTQNDDTIDKPHKRYNSYRSSFKKFGKMLTKS